MLFNKNVGKKILVGVAAVALFAPVALGGGQAHAMTGQEAFEKLNTPQGAAKSREQGREMERAQGAWADAHPKEANTVSPAGGPAGGDKNAGTPASNSDSASQSSSNSGNHSQGNTNDDYMATSSNNQISHKSHKTRYYKNDKSKDVKYSKVSKYKKNHSKKINKRRITKKIIRLHKKGFSNKKIAKKLDIHVSMVKHVIK